MEGFVQEMGHLKALLSNALGALMKFEWFFPSALRKFIMVLCGGGLGAASRYAVNLLAARLLGTGFPWGTLIVNLTGCFLIGLLFALTDRVRLLTPEMRLFLITGYLGALTTFSSFSIETVNAARAGLALQPLVNILVNNLIGMSLTFFGMWVGAAK